MDRSQKKKSCKFCLTSMTDEVFLGDWYSLKSLRVHYYCLLFSSYLEQNGKDDEGILGFLDKDIQKELKRGLNIQCTYCNKYGATIRCVGSKCNVAFHLPCGLKKNSFHEFFGRFSSFCQAHRPKIKNRPSGLCNICLEYNKEKNFYNYVYVSCCKDKMCFHRRCISQLALTAGKHFLKCPLCNNNKEFIEQIETQGVYIPERDAAWELEPGAYQDLLFRPNKCDITSCKCPKGREYNDSYSRWEIYICNVCGSTGAHKQCGNVKELNWSCDQCQNMIKEMSLKHKQNVLGNDANNQNDSGESSSSNLPNVTQIEKTDESDIILIDSENEDEKKENIDEPSSMLVTKDGIRIPVYRFSNDLDSEPPEKKFRPSNSESLSSCHNSTRPPPTPDVVLIDLTDEQAPEKQTRPLSKDTVEEVIILD